MTLNLFKRYPLNFQGLRNGFLCGGCIMSIPCKRFGTEIPLNTPIFKEICIALQFPMVVMNSVFLDNLIHWRSFVDVLYTVRWLYLSLFKIINFHTLSYEVLVLWNLKQCVRVHTFIIIDTLYIGGSWLMEIHNHRHKHYRLEACA